MSIPKSDVCKFEDKLSGSTSAPHAHSHDHGDGGGAHIHSDLLSAAEHGHTHEHLDHAGEDFTSSLDTYHLTEPLIMLFHLIREVCRKRSARLFEQRFQGAWIYYRDRGVRNLRSIIVLSLFFIIIEVRVNHSPVGSGKTALTLALCRALRDKYNIGESRALFR